MHQSSKKFTIDGPAGQLEAMLLTIRGFEFPEQRDAWLEARPGADERFREWYRETFGRELEIG